MAVFGASYVAQESAPGLFPRSGGEHGQPHGTELRYFGDGDRRRDAREASGAVPSVLWVRGGGFRGSDRIEASGRGDSSRGPRADGTLDRLRDSTSA